MIKKLLVISLTLLIILSNFYFLVFNENFYLKQAEKQNTLQYKENYINIINYLKNNEPLKNFNEKEVLHMKDVKNIIQNTIYLLYLSIISSLTIIFYFIYKKQYKKINSSLKYSSITTIAFLLIFSAITLMSFEKSFIYFHKIFFTNDLWILNPVTDLLINLLPQQFFINFTKQLIINSFIASIIIFLSTLIAKTLKKRRLSDFHG